MSKKWLMVLGAFLSGILVVAGVGFWLFSQLQPVAPANTTKQRFVIAKGQSVVATAQKLQSAGLIKNARLFRLYAQYKKLDVQMQAGSYELSPNMTTEAIAQKLTQGSEDIWVTLLEGWRIAEVAEYLDAQDLPEFDAAAFAELASASEGMIFPDTYLVPRESTAAQLYALFTTTFEKKVATELATDIAQSKLSLAQVVTLASLVEREGRGFTDMRHVAGILHNRLDLGMPLQADATLQYISGKNMQTGKWWEQPNISIKESTSPYNTYKYPGLPAGPICNPGLHAIKAVLDPIASDDLFYIHAPSGESYYSKTLQEHNANIDKYLR